jgi:hypothetical protein
MEGRVSQAHYRLGLSKMGRGIDRILTGLIQAFYLLFCLEHLLKDCLKSLATPEDF